IQQYADGPARLRAALAKVPPQALTWRPAPKEWSAHEVICHCADSETNAYARIRFLVAEKSPNIQGYDQDNWARVFAYHDLPLEPRHQDQREDELAEASLVHALEQERAGDSAGDRGQRESQGETPHPGRQEARPPVTDENRALVHDEEGLEIGLDRARAPALRRRVEHHRRTRETDRAADGAGEGSGAEPPSTPLELLRIEPADLEHPRHDEHQPDEPV